MSLEGGRPTSSSLSSSALPRISNQQALIIKAKYLAHMTVDYWQKANLPKCWTVPLTYFQFSVQFCFIVKGILVLLWHDDLITWWLQFNNSNRTENLMSKHQPTNHCNVNKHVNAAQRFPSLWLYLLSIYGHRSQTIQGNKIAFEYLVSKHCNIPYHC